MVSGFIASILGLVLSDKYIVVGKVRHSQRMNEPPVLVNTLVSLLEIRCHHTFSDNLEHTNIHLLLFLTKQRLKSFESP